MIDAYRTIKGPVSARLTRKKSRFLAHAVPVDSQEAIDERLAEIRRQYHDASHHCSAWRVRGEGEPLVHSDDDGEPAGSAGLPILQQIEGQDLLDVMVVVVRYFGGTKLGVGGLIRAYSDAAREALAAAHIVVRQVRIEVSIRFPPEVNSGVMGTIHRAGADVLEIAYDDRPHVRVAIPPSAVERFVASIRDATAARATIEVAR